MASCSPGSRGSDVWQADGAGNAGRQDRRQSASRMDTANKEVVWIRKLWRDGSSGPGWLPIDIGYGGDRIRQGNFRLATGPDEWWYQERWDARFLQRNLRESG